jgi:general secretion pathway protein E
MVTKHIKRALGLGGTKATEASPNALRVSIVSTAPKVEPPAATPIAQDAGNADLPGSVYDGEIESDDQLPLFVDTLYKVTELSDFYQRYVCPILLDNKEGRKEFALVLQEEDLHADFVTELIRQLERLGYHKASPLFYCANNTVMLQLHRGEVKSNKRFRDTASSKNYTPDEQSALLATFQEAAKFALANEANDIHFELHTEQRGARSFLKFGIDGHLISPARFKMETQLLQDTAAFLFNCKSSSGSQSTYNQNLKQQSQIRLHVNGKSIMFRWASAPCAYGSKIVLRVIPQPTIGHTVQVRSLEELGYLPDQITTWNRAISGLGGATIIAGVTGSGKSTTLQRVMSEVPGDWVKYTIEEPIELRMGADTCQMAVSRKLGGKEEDDPYTEYQQQLMRMAPDVVMIGEVRDRATAGLLRYVAGSGHRGFTTTHAPSALDIVFLRLLSAEFGIPKEVVATPGFLNLLVYQALISRLCEHCHVAATDALQADYLRRIEHMFDLDIAKLRARNIHGCPHCRRDGVPELNGYGKRTVVAEMVEVTEDMLPYIRDNRALELKRYVRSLRTARYDEPDSTGKSALEVAMYHVSTGLVDPRTVESRFGSFDNYERTHNRVNAGTRIPRIAAGSRVNGQVTRRGGVTGFAMRRRPM